MANPVLQVARMIVALGLVVATIGGGATPVRADEACRYVPAPPQPMPTRQIGSLTELKPVVAGFSDRVGAAAVLVVFDIDNTLMTADRDFGSDAWFKWQEALLDRAPCKAERVADDFPGLLQVQYLAYAIGRMRPTQTETAAVIADLVNAGHGVIALTARGPEIRSPTLRELDRNGIGFATAPSCGPGPAGAPSLCTRRGIVPGKTILAVAERTLSQAERAALGAKPRPVSYSNGVMMVAGQNKGLMLRLLLASIGTTYQAIVFVDDGADNVTDVAAAFAGDATPRAAALWYTAYEAANAGFWEDGARRAAAVEDWQTIGAALCKSTGTYCTR